MLRKIGLALAAILGSVLVVVLGALGYAQTRIGQEQLAGLLERQLSGPGQQAEVEGLSGFLPFDIRLKSFRLRDAEGVWLEVDGARLEIAPGALLRGEIAVRQVGAQRVALNRLPAGAPESEPEEPFSLPRLPELPGNLPPVAVDRLFVDALELGRPVLGESATFALDGSATTGPGGGRAEARLAARRTDEPTARLDLDARLDLASESLTLDLQGSETGGLLAAATGHPEAGALRVSLVGQGPLSGWEGRLTVDAERLAKLDLAVHLAYADQRRIAVAGTLDAAPGALPVEIAEVVGTHAELSLRAAETAPRRFALQDLSLKAAGLSLTGSGSADLAANTIDGSAVLDVPDLARFAGLAGFPLDGTAALRLAASGAARQPDLRLSLEATDLAATDVAVQRLGATFDAAFTAPLGEGPVGVRASGTAEATGLALDGRILGEDGRLTLELDGELPPEGAATVRKLALRSSLFELAGRASVDRESLAGTAHLEAAIPDLAAVAKDLGVDPAAAPLPDGAFRLGADAIIAGRAERVEVTLDGSGSGLSGLPPGVQELVGPAPTLQARAVVEPGRAAAFESLTLAGEGVRVEGEPRYGFADQSLGGELRL
ncbi:MAG TPA: hypothetical protein VFY87_26915, partial [Geminicoccaceae bacterium]|nr:hypothetical protein [Geminicoccaceae bacterium]